MNREIILSIHIFLIATFTCFSQSNQELIGGFESNTKYVYGYSEDFRENIYLGITFGNAKSSFDTTYYIKFQISVPETDFRSDINIRKSSAIKIIAANEQIVDLELADVESSTHTEKLTTDPFAPTQLYNHTTTLFLQVSKSKILEIAKEPFYKLVLPCDFSSSKTEIVFVKPTLFVRRNFIQKNAKYILGLSR